MLLFFLNHVSLFVFVFFNFQLKETAKRLFTYTLFFYKSANRLFFCFLKLYLSISEVCEFVWVTLQCVIRLSDRLYRQDRNKALLNKNQKNICNFCENIHRWCRVKFIKILIFGGWVGESYFTQKKIIFFLKNLTVIKHGITYNI